MERKKLSSVKSLSLSFAQWNNGQTGTIHLLTVSNLENETNQGAGRLAEHNMLSNLLYTAP